MDAMALFRDLGCERTVAIPFFHPLTTSHDGLAVMESVLLELVSRIKCDGSPNGCLICNSMAELGTGSDPRIARIFKACVKRVEANVRAAILRARELGEVSRATTPRDTRRGLSPIPLGCRTWQRCRGSGN
jgi:hypothetical protein